MQIGIALLIGFMMSIGLMISGMVNPQKVIGFLDIFGHFDPTLAFVMAGALLVVILGYRLINCCSKPLLCDDFDKPGKTKVDLPLLIGSALFGIGWGLAGFCPGPVIVGLGLGLSKAFSFTLFMLAGMITAKWILKVWKS